jgi:predicted enzyme related to lactoylglutathione lyase
MYNSICHIEFDVTDLERSRAYYEGLFGWRFSDFGIPSMIVFGQGDSHIGGLMQVEEVKASSSPSLWFRVEDLDTMLTKAESLGGKVFSGRSEVPGVGWSAVVDDPDGNHIGLVQYREDH